MVFCLQLAFPVLLAGLVLLGVIAAKLREMAETGRAAPRGLTSRPLRGDTEIVLSNSRDWLKCRRRVGFEDNAKSCDGIDRISGKSGLSGESAEEIAIERNYVREIEIENQSEDTEVKGWAKESRSGRGWFDEDDNDDDDDWEGIEKTELERAFDRAVMLLDSLKSSGLVPEIGRDEKMKLYGLQKIATEGPCHEPQPLPFKVSARAKWCAWQQLGSMSPEDAMQQYIDRVSAISPEPTQSDLAGQQ